MKIYKLFHRDLNDHETDTTVWITDSS